MPADRFQHALGLVSIGAARGEAEGGAGEVSGGEPQDPGAVCRPEAQAGRRAGGPGGGEGGGTGRGGFAGAQRDSHRRARWGGIVGCALRTGWSSSLLLTCLVHRHPEVKLPSFRLPQREAIPDIGPSGSMSSMLLTTSFSLTASRSHPALLCACAVGGHPDISLTSYASLATPSRRNDTQPALPLCFHSGRPSPTSATTR